MTYELIEASASDKEVADTEERTALVESNNLVLKTNVLSLERAMAQMNPSNQPITSVEASVSFLVAGTNTEIFDDLFLKSYARDAQYLAPEQIFEEGTEFSLAMADIRFPQYGRGFPGWLVCNKFETSLGRKSVRLNNESVISFKLEFGLQSPDDLDFDPFLLRIWQNFTAGKAEDNNIANVEIPFLKEGAKIVRGTCILTINQDVKTFSVWRPPQAMDGDAIIFVADPPATNRFNR